MLDDVTARLTGFGYTVTEADNFALNFIIKTVEDKIIRDCGVHDPETDTMVIPDGLHNTAVDMVCGEFLMEKKSTGQLTGIDTSPVEKSISEGDTSVTYAIGSGDKTNEQRLDELIASLKARESDLVRFRRFTW